MVASNRFFLSSIHTTEREKEMGQQPLLSIGASCIEKLPFLELKFMPYVMHAG